ncbi:peptidase S41 family protein [Cladophialophora carrionii]|uniref:Peptidase S41 family protein n=1 Tax=Cladophialophora carrionii TaxID=86049 RepID=A0A1C1D302_9EURO|nr:peptidase S41 family protein [Cladophialophora carrionii]
MVSSIAFKALWVLAFAATARSQSSTTGATPTLADEPCAQVSALQSQYAASSGTVTGFPVSPDLAYACQQSVPLVKEDTMSLLTGLKAWVEWQSTLAWLKDPPPDWPFPPVDLTSELQKLGDKVQDGTITSEIDFEWQLVDIITSARDGHLTFAPDAYSVFAYFNPLGSLVSVSADGKQLPEVYLYSESFLQTLFEQATDGDEDDLQTSAAEGWNPSPIVKINGTDAVTWLSQKAFNETMTHQDLDALYNRLFFSINAPPDGSGFGYFYVPALARFYGSSITVEFKNGSEVSSPLEASSIYNFSGVVDGETFYQSFCNVTAKAMAQETSSSTPAPQPSSTGAQDPNSLRPQYPSPVAISSDASLAGYFLEDEPSVAVLSVTAMSEAAQFSVQQSLAKFLDQCREKNKTHLIVDVSQNGGGTILVAYDILKQLFPTIEPYLGAQFRANAQAQQAEREQPDNVTFALYAGAYSLFDASSVSNDSGHAFESWDQLFGPVRVHGDDFSHQLQVNISDATNDEQSGSIVVSGYANNSAIPPQPFESRNIIAFGDGFCGSACTILLHMLKYQGKVESIVAGGRPQNGPGQAMGGVKGSRVEPLADAMQFVELFYEGAPADMIERANKTALKDLWDNAEVLQLRNDENNGHVQVNIFNAIAQYDDSQTPLQFVYEAADCRLWYQPSHLLDITALWRTVAEQAFALNGQEKFSLCVPGSTGHPSSLSGNQTLFDDGQIVNVTGYNPEGNGGDGSSGEENGSAASSIGLSGTLLVTVLGLVTLAGEVIF